MAYFNIVRDTKDQTIRNLAGEMENLAGLHDSQRLRELSARLHQEMGKVYRDPAYGTETVRSLERLVRHADSR